MAFPKIAIKVTNFEHTRGLSDLVDQKLVSLGKLIPGGATDASCRVEIKRLTEHQSGKIYKCEIDLFFDGRNYRTEATEDQVEGAIDEARDELRHALTHIQGKQKSRIRRGGQILKDMLRFGK